MKAVNMRHPLSKTPAKTLDARKRLVLALGALGIVFGDIGTSPLYTIRECFHGIHAVEPSPGNIHGVLSLILWSLMIVVSIKYVIFLMNTDNKGEGGIFALLALASSSRKHAKIVHPAVMFAGLLGASLLYGDGLITPSITVLSAVEGLNVATDAVAGFVVPISCLILFLLFSIQRHGTAGIGQMFGPVMLLWFATIAILGLSQIVRQPQILMSINPVCAYQFFAANSFHGLVVLGSVVLCITGAEALYADLGHFGAGPIRLSWFMVAFPSLLLNYFGQGALLLEHPELAFSPFYSLVPRPLLYPMVGLATLAAIIASQAMISGAFSLTRQAIQLGYLPRMPIVHTSSSVEGQIYIPQINSIMMVICIALVLFFGQSSRLAGAYGVAVTADMTITSLIFFLVATKTLKWSWYKTLPLVSFFLIFEISYFGSNLLKFFDGGWFPIAAAVIIVTIMTTWKTGRAQLYEKLKGGLLPLDEFAKDIATHKVHRVPGMMVVLASSSGLTPLSLLHHFRHVRVLHEHVVILTIVSSDESVVKDSERTSYIDMGQGFVKVTATYGFMETPDVPKIINKLQQQDVIPKMVTVSFYLGKETLVLLPRHGMNIWRKRLFAFLSRNSTSAAYYFGIPPGSVVELGAQVEL